MPGREVSVGEVPYLTNSRVWMVFHISVAAEQGRGPSQERSEGGLGPYLTINRIMDEVP